MKFRNMEILEFFSETAFRFVLCVVALFLISKLLGIFTVETGFGVCIGLVLYDSVRFIFEKIKIRKILK